MADWRGRMWSNLRIADYIMRRLDKLGIEYDVDGYCLSENRSLRGESAYISVQAFDAETEQEEIVLTIRVGDHAQVVGGGYNEERQARNGESDVDVSPDSGIGWREAVTRARLATGKTCAP